MKYVCPSCKSINQVEEVLINATVATPIFLGDDDYVFYGDWSVKSGEVSHYQCGSCGATVTDANGHVINDQDELITIMKGEEG